MHRLQKQLWAEKKRRDGSSFENQVWLYTPTDTFIGSFQTLNLSSFLVCYI